MFRSTKSTLLALSAAAVLAGCTATPVEEPPATPEPVEPVNVEPAYQVLQNVTESERFRFALSQLEAGETEIAKAELQAYINSGARGKIAPNLLKQLNTDASDYFPAENFEVALESGETLSTLAKEYLGDLYQFYALAKYNGIDVPRNTKIGDIIKIPATPSALLAQQARESGVADAASGVEGVEVVVEEVVEDIKVDAEGVASDTAIEMEVPKPEVMENPVETLQGLADSAAQTGDYESALTALAAFPPALIPDNWSLLSATWQGAAGATEDAVQSAQHLVNAAGVEREFGSADQALALLEQAAAADPENSTAAQSAADLKTELIDTYHRDASSAFRAQELTKAVSLWDRVLELDPQHNNAQVYRTQALELMERLKKLGN